MKEMPPQEILDAAKLIDDWMSEHGYREWQLMGVCSRSYAYEVFNIKRIIDQYETRSQFIDCER